MTDFRIPFFGPDIGKLNYQTNSSGNILSNSGSFLSNLSPSFKKFCFNFNFGSFCPDDSNQYVRIIGVISIYSDIVA